MPTPEKRKPRFTVNAAVWGASAATAAVAGLFSLIVATLLTANYVQLRALTPEDSPQLIALREQLAAAPQADPRLIEQMQALDLLARKAVFTSQAQVRTGAWLLLGGVGVLLAALKLAAVSNPRIPLPEPAPSAATFWLTRARARRAVAAAGILLAAAGLASALFSGPGVPAAPGSASAPAASAPETAPVAYPDWAEVQRNWPSFRGPGGYGVAFYTNAPTEWDGESGKNIKWTADVPLPGTNSPVVWGNRVYLSGATADEREVYCFDTETGALVWRRKLDKLPGSPDTAPEVSHDTGYAAPTLAAHGDRAFAMFANGDVVCLNAGGDVVWGKNLGVPDNHYGHASSLLAHQNLLFVQFDDKSNPRLLALDIADGREAWTAKRQYISWASPVCVQGARGPELVLNSEKNVDAYDPLTGKALWSLACLDGEVAPSPAYGGGMYFVANDNATATAIRFREEDGRATPEIAWQWDEALPDVASPLGSDTHFYVATSLGYIICLDIASGKVAWGEEFDQGFYASPILAGGRIFAVDKKGTTHVFEDGPAYKAVAACKLGEAVFATPAFLDGRIYFRTEKRLICVARQDGT